MATLNRFPLFGLWAAEAALRAGYNKDEATSLGHAYAVLYAIRARGPYKGKGYYKGKEKKRVPIAKPGTPQINQDQINFCGDMLDVVYVDDRIRGRVGGGALQTPKSFETAIWLKIPADYREPLAQAFRAFWASRNEREANSSSVYSLYDNWKQACADKRRFVDLDALLQWIKERTHEVPNEARNAASAAQNA